MFVAIHVEVPDFGPTFLQLQKYEKYQPNSA